MTDNKMNKKILGSFKKDSVGLFNGGYKAERFETKMEKEDRKRKRTQDWLEYSEEVEEIDEDWS